MHDYGLSLIDDMLGGGPVLEVFQCVLEGDVIGRVCL